MNEEHQRPDGVSDEIVAAMGKVTEAFEWIERARGRLYDFHQMIGRADLLMEEGSELLERAGANDLGDLLRGDIIGRNVLDGRWTYQAVEEFDATYYRPVMETERKVREELVEGRRHVYEAEMKERRRTPGREGHEAEPPRHPEGKTS